MRIECRRREKERGVWRDCNVSVWITRARQSWISHGGVSVGYVRRAHKDSNEERMRKRGKRPATSARMLFAPFFLLCIIGKRPSEKESIVQGSAKRRFLGCVNSLSSWLCLAVD